jgi:hypothetical protein
MPRLRRVIEAPGSGRRKSARHDICATLHEIEERGTRYGDRCKKHLARYLDDDDKRMVIAFDRRPWSRKSLQGTNHWITRDLGYGAMKKAAT